MRFIKEVADTFKIGLFKREYLNYTGVALQFLVAIPIVLAYNKGALFNPLSYILWAMLSLIATIAHIRVKGNWQLTAAWFLIDSSLGTYFLVSGTKIEFGSVQVFVALVTLGTGIVYGILILLDKERWAVVVCTVALVFLAPIPMVRDYVRDPATVDMLSWIVYTVSNALCFVGKKLSIENSAVSGFSAVLCVLIVMIGLS